MSYEQMSNGTYSAQASQTQDTQEQGEETLSGMLESIQDSESDWVKRIQAQFATRMLFEKAYQQHVDMSVQADDYLEAMHFLMAQGSAANNIVDLVFGTIIASITTPFTQSVKLMKVLNILLALIGLRGVATGKYLASIPVDCMVIFLTMRKRIDPASYQHVVNALRDYFMTTLILWWTSLTNRVMPVRNPQSVQEEFGEEGDECDPFQPYAQATVETFWCNELRRINNKAHQYLINMVYAWSDSTVGDISSRIDNGTLTTTRGTKMHPPVVCERSLITGPGGITVGYVVKSLIPGISVAEYNGVKSIVIDYDNFRNARPTPFTIMAVPGNEYGRDITDMLNNIYVSNDGLDRPAYKRGWKNIPISKETYPDFTPSFA